MTFGALEVLQQLVVVGLLVAQHQGEDGGDGELEDDGREQQDAEGRKGHVLVLEGHGDQNEVEQAGDGRGGQREGEVAPVGIGAAVEVVGLVG